MTVRTVVIIAIIGLLEQEFALLVVLVVAPEAEGEPEEGLESQENRHWEAHPVYV